MLCLRPFITTWKLVSRDIFFWLAIFLGFSYIIGLFILFIYSPAHFNLGNALTMASYFLQATLITFMMLGIYVVRLDYTLKFHHYGEKKTIYIYQIFGKIFFALVLVITICSILTLLFYLLLFMRGITFTSFHLNSFKYIFLYWGSGIFISYTTGVLLALWIKNLSVYFLSVIISFLIGPLNFTLVNYETAQFLNLGQLDYDYFYHPHYGFALENYQITKRILLISLLMFMITLTVNFKVKKMNIFFIAIYIAICSCVFFSTLKLNEPEQIVRFNANPENEIYKEFNYYEGLEPQYLKQNLKVSRYDIELDTKGALGAKVKMDIQTDDPDANLLYFSLYHGFKIKKILINGECVSFNHKKDTVIIENKSGYRKGNIYMEYEGISSPLFFANSQAIYLPNHFPWLPSVNLTPAMTVYEGNFHRNTFRPHYKTQYNLIYNGKQKIFTNIDQKEGQSFSGISDNGLTIVAGDIIQKDIEGKQVIIPSSWQLALKNYSTFEKRITSLIETIHSNLGYDNKLPDKIIILPKIVTFDSLFEDNAWLYSDHIIINYPIYMSQDETGLLKDEHIAYSLIPAFTWKNEKEYYDLEMPIIFNAAYGHFYLTNYLGIEDGYFSFIESKYKEHNPLKKEVLGKIGYFINAKERKEKVAFFREWDSLLRERRNFSWADLRQLIQKYSKGD